jgi:hypothetical protein
MTTKEFRLPSKTSTSLDGDQNSLVAQKGKQRKFFFLKNDSIGPTPFGCNMVGVCWMAIEIFWLSRKGEVHVISVLKKTHPPMPFWATKILYLPFNGGGVLVGN